MIARIPQPELVEFQRLPDDVRSGVERWLRELSAVSKPIQRSLAEVAARMGVSLATARAKYDAWRKSADWRVLMDRRRVPDDRSLDPELVEYWKALCQQNGRKCLPAHRQLKRRYFAGEAIPGIPAGPRTHLPRGLSYANLIRYRPSNFELTAARIGRTAASGMGPMVFTTRVGMEVGQRYVFDDMWHDFKVAVLGQRRACRLLQLHAHDIFSGCQFARGIKPRIENPETGQSVGLNQEEMLFLVAHVLDATGYHPSGTVLMVEHGTAAIADDIEQLLHDLTGGLVRVDRSGIQGASAFAGQYVGRGKGNFRFKASLESLGNLIHNETAGFLDFPGQTGSNSRLNAPEELHGRERNLDGLQKAILALAPARAALLRLPFLEANQAMQLVEDVMERINLRTDHDLEGWLEAGLTTVDYDVPGVGVITGQKVLALDPARRAAVEAVAVPVARRLSPREVFDGGRRRLIRLRPEQLARLLGSRMRRTVTVRNHLIEFEDRNISPSPLRYVAHHWRDGEKLDVVVNPFGPQEAHLFDARGRWLGAVRAWQSVSHLDEQGLHEQMGKAAAIEAQLLAPLARRGAALTKARLEAAEHNATVLRGEPVTAEEIESVERVTAQGPSAAADILARATRPAEDAEEISGAGDSLLAALGRTQPEE